MKILYLIHQFYPECSTGTEKVILNLAKMMQRYGHRVKVITSSFYESSFYDRRLGRVAIKEFVYEDVPVLAFRYLDGPGNLHYGLENPALAEVAGDLIRREKPDVVHAGHCMGVTDLLRSAQHSGIPSIVTLTDFFLICPKYTLIRTNGSQCRGPESGQACKQHCPELAAETIPERLVLAHDILKYAETITAPSRFLAHLFESEFGDLNIRVVEHGVRLRRLKCNSRRYSQGDRIVFGYAGLLKSHKGAHELIEAFMQVHSCNTTLKLYGIDTAESYFSLLKGMAEKDKRIEFCGEYADDQVADILQTVDVVIMPPAGFENYPFVLLEAFASDVPVIAPNVDGIAEKISNEFNGFVFSGGQPSHLSELLEKVINNPESLNPLKDNIKQMVLPTVEQEAYAYEEIYQSVSGNG